MTTLVLRNYGSPMSPFSRTTTNNKETRHDEQKPPKRPVVWELDFDRLLSNGELIQLFDSSRSSLNEALARQDRTPVMDCVLVELGLGTGLRAAELAALRLCDLRLNLPGNHHALRVRNGKGGKARTVPLSDELAERVIWLRNWKQREGEPLDDDAPVFLSRKTKSCLSVRALQHSWKRSLLRAGLPHRPLHSTRHTYALLLYRSSGRDLRMVQKILGHSSLNTTANYLSVLQEDVITAVEGLWSGLSESEAA